MSAQAVLRGWVMAASLLVLGACSVAPVWRGAAPPVTSMRPAVQTRLDLARAYLEQGQARVALEELQRAQRLDARQSEVYHLQALAWQQLQQPDAAEAAYAQALRLAPHDALVWHNLAGHRCQQGQWAAAEQAFERALATPAAGRLAASTTWLARSLCLSRAARWAAAAQAMQQALDGGADPTTVRLSLAAQLHQQGEHERADAVLAPVLAQPEPGAAVLWLGLRVQRALQRPEAADRLAQVLLNRYPDAPETRAYQQGVFHDR